MDQQRELSMLQQNRVDDILRREYPRSEKRFFVAAKDASRSDPTRDDSQTASPSTLPILGFVTWDVLPLGTSEAEWQAEHDKDHGLPPLNAFIAHSNPVAKAIVGVDIPHIRLTQLYVHPEYRRQGIATRLVAQVLKEADQSRLPVYLVSTADGGKL